VTTNKEGSLSTLSPFLPSVFEPLVSSNLVHLTALEAGLLETCKKLQNSIREIPYFICNSDKCKSGIIIYFKVYADRDYQNSSYWS
jgi:hypothetical protein